MIRVPLPRPVASSRVFPIVTVAVVLAMALMAAVTPNAHAAPAVPHFGSNVQVDQAPGYLGGQPSLKVGSDEVLYVAYSGWGGPATGTDVFFTKSADGGRTWTVPIRVNNDATNTAQSEPALTLDNANNIYIAWTDGRNGNNDIYFSKSTDRGASFPGNIRVHEVLPSAQQEPDVAVDSLANPVIVYVVWTDFRNAGTGADIYYANSTDGGLSFTTPTTRLNTDAGNVEQGSPAIAVSPDRSVDIVWRDPRNAARGTDIYFVKSTDRGVTWSPNPPTVMNDDLGPAGQVEPALAVNETGAIFVVWTDYRNANTAPDIYERTSTNGGNSFAANVRVDDSSGPVQQIQPSVAAHGGKVQVAWSDYRTGGPFPYAIYTASSSDGITWSPNVKVNGDTGTNFESNPTIGLDSAGNVFTAWLNWSTIAFLGIRQSVLAATLDVVAPISNAGPALSGDDGAAIAFNGSASSDNLGIASSAWDFGDGSNANGLKLTHTYAKPGAFTAILTVWDYSGNSAMSTTTVTVRDTKAPVPLGGGDRSVDETQSLFFDASASTDNVGVVSYAWDFGDGSSASTVTANHVYAHPGVYQATLTVTDAAGHSATSNFQVTVRSSPFLGWIEILAGIVAVLTIAVIPLGWMAWGRRKRDEKHFGGPSAEHQVQAPPPPRDPDPLDMSFPPAPPKEP